MKKQLFSSLCAFSLLSGALPLSAALAADQEQSGSVTKDTSKNPITGTQTTTIKRKIKKKGDGKNDEVTQKEVIKEKTNGEVDHKVKTNVDSEHK